MCCCFGCCSYEDGRDFSPKAKRNCTDVAFLLLFLLFCSGLGITTWYALSRGDPYRILYGSDSFGNTCGRQNERMMIRNRMGEFEEFQLSGQDMRRKRLMFPMNSTNPLETIWSCVAACPNQAIGSEAELSAYMRRSNNSLCLDASPQICPSLPVQKSLSIVNRCIPENIIALSHELAKKVVEMDFIRGYLSEVVLSASFILKMCLIALVLSVISVFLLRFFAPVLIYFIYILVILVSLAISGTLWYTVYLTTISQESPSTPAPAVDLDKLQVATFIKLGESRIDSWLRMENTNQLTIIGLAIGASVITIFVTMVVWCLLPRGQKMIKLFKQASKAIAAMPSLLLQPIVSSFLIICVAMYTLSSCFLLWTAGETVTREVNLETGRTVTVIESNVTDTTRFMFFYQLVGFVWLSEFVLACQRLFIAGAISLWYFDSVNKFSSRSSLCRSLFNTVRYHLGSAALGSFIITLIKVPRYILMYIYAKMKAVENPIARRLLACFICILSYIERCLNYINYNAYTVIAYSGKSFCPAARMAVSTLLDNAIDVAALNSVGDAVLYLTKFIVSAITATIAAYQISSLNLNHPWLPVLIIFICSYLIANCFLSIYAIALDTLLICCAEDADMAREQGGNQQSNQQFEELMTLSRMEGKRRLRDEQERIPLNQF